jgi:hypothetical protein
MAVLTREFPLDPKILGKGSAASLTLGGTTKASTLASIAVNDPFPAGTIELGHIALEAGTGSGINFKSGAAKVTFDFSASVQSGVGVFDTSDAAFASLQLDAPSKVKPKIPQISGTRWAAMRAGYGVSGSISGSHPLGVIGSATFGVDAKRNALFGLIHRFDGQTGARDALGETFNCWRLPRHVDYEAGDVNLKPGTWIVAEADGSLALTVGARLGYEVSFVHESRVLGLTRDLGARIDANLKATFGITVTGRYLVVVGREGRQPEVRVRLYKQSKKGLKFGLNLNVGVKGIVPVPKTFDSFVETVFSVHGPQVLDDLHAIEDWIDPEKDLGDTAARLISKTGKDLLHRTTGLDVDARFAEAQKMVVEALRGWNRLPGPVNALLWRLLSNPPDEAIERLKKLLRRLSDPEPRTREDALSGAIEAAAASDNAESNWLQAISDRGMLALGQDTGRVSELASGTLAVLESDVVRRLHEFVTTRLDLDALRRATKDEDFNALDEWLIKRLGDLINKQAPQLEDLKEIQKALFAVDAKVRGIYDSGIKALTKRYSREVAATYQETSTDTALLDVSFDLSVPAALALFRTVVHDGDLNDLLTTPTEAVTLHEAALSHGIRKTSHVEVRLPFISRTIDRVTDSLAKLTVEEHAGRVLVYEFAASDKLKVANRTRSELSVLGTMRAAAGRAAEVTASGTIAYEARQVKRGMRPAELQHRTRPFIEAYLAPLFGGGDASIRSFFADLDAAASAALQNQSNQLGDVALSMQVSYPVRVLESWLMPRDEGTLHRDAMNLSRAVQSSLKRLLSEAYFEDLDHLQFQEPAAALLVWSSMPISTSIDAQGAALRFNTDRDVYWDYANAAERRAFARDPHTAAALGAQLDESQVRLVEAGRDPGRFHRGRVGQFIDLALGSGGDLYLSSLLRAEALIVKGAERALRTIAAATAQAGTAPAVAVETLAEFAATLVETFSGRLDFVYSPEAVRTLGPALLADASAAIHPVFRTSAPSAMLRLYVLKRDHAFAAETFLEGEQPSMEAVALAQTLVRV